MTVEEPHPAAAVQVTPTISVPESRSLSPEEIAYVQKLERGRRLDLDVRGVIALLTLTFFFAYAMLQYVMSRRVDLPPGLVAPVTLILTFYFASKGSNGDGQKGKHGE